MADIQAPTAVVNTQQAVEVDNLAERRLLEQEFLKLLERQMTLLDPLRGYEVR
jgi:hypothetical protein